MQSARQTCIFCLKREVIDYLPASFHATKDKYILLTCCQHKAELLSAFMEKEKVFFSVQRFVLIGAF